MANTRYFEYQTGYNGCIEALLKEGGQVYTSDGKGGASVHVRGCYVSTYWEPNSKRRGEVYEACEMFGYDPYGMTGGRLIRSLIRDIIQLNYKDTYYHNSYEKLAKNGSHWHYQFINPGDNGLCVEFDLKSAYFTSYLSLPSALLNGLDKFVDDAGAMERIKTLSDLFPKWLRLQFLGVLASHSKSTITRRNGKNGWQLHTNKMPSIETGYAFNAAHRAILRTYKIMQEIHRIGGENIARIHTDSFMLKASTPDHVEAELFNYIKSQGHSVAVKGMGRAYFFDLNTGAIGRKIVGQKQEVLEKFKEAKEPHTPQEIALELIERWGHIIEEIEKGMNGRKSIPIQWEQLQLPTGYQDFTRENYTSAA